MEFCWTKLSIGCFCHHFFQKCGGDTCKYAFHEICGKRDNVCFDKSFTLGWSVIEGRTACPDCVLKIKQSWTIKKLKIE